MKKTWMALPAALVLTLAGCGGNYPGNATLELPDQIPENVSLSGVVLELDSSIMDSLEPLEAMREEIRAFMEDPDGISLSFWRDISSERREQIEALRDEYAEAQAARMQAYNDWRAEQTNNLEQARTEREVVEAERERFQSFAGEAEARVTIISDNIKAAEERQGAIGNEVRDYTNQRIIDEQLAVRQLGQRANVLSWRSSRWRDGVDISGLSCDQHDDRVTLDLTAEDRSCVYISYPVAALANEEYDELLRKATREHLELNRDIGQTSTWNRQATGLRGELQEAREALQNAQILAENQTGTTARTLESNLNQLNARINRMEQQLSEAADQLTEGRFAHFVPVDRSAGTQTARQLRNSLNGHLADTRERIVERAIKNEVELDGQGNASGLSRKGDYVLALVDFREQSSFGRTRVEHIASLIDVSNNEPTIRDKQLVITTDDPVVGSGSYTADDRITDLVYRAFTRLQSNN